MNLLAMEVSEAIISHVRSTNFANDLLFVHGPDKDVLFEIGVNVVYMTASSKQVVSGSFEHCSYVGSDEEAFRTNFRVAGEPRWAFQARFSRPPSLTTGPIPEWMLARAVRFDAHAVAQFTEWKQTHHESSQAVFTVEGIQDMNEVADIHKLRALGGPVIVLVHSVAWLPSYGSAIDVLFSESAAYWELSTSSFFQGDPSTWIYSDVRFRHRMVRARDLLSREAMEFDPHRPDPTEDKIEEERMASLDAAF